MELKPDVKLSIKNLSCSFDGLRAVLDLSCEARAGTIIAMIGPNGAGKSTVFNLCGGFVKSDFGHIEVCGRRTTGMRPDQIAQLGLGRTFQDCKVFNQLSVFDNVLLGYRNQSEETLMSALIRSRSLRLSETRRRFEALTLLDEAGLGDKSESMACDLSYGQKKLLELCRVRAFNPEVYLLDEPFAGLFPNMAEKMEIIITKLAKSGRIVIFIEHDMGVVARIADRVLVLDFGRLIADSSPEAVLSDLSVLDAYLGKRPD